MTPEQFLSRCPTLWHVAPAGTWETAGQLGLRTAAQLIDAAALDETRRASLRTELRKEAVVLQVGEREVRLRDQAPLLRVDLTKLLQPGVTVADWIGLLNRRLYLFSGRKAMTTLLTKYVERDGAQDVFTFSPRRLLDTVRLRIELSAQNSGAIARRSDPYKGRDTFLSISRFPDRRPAEVTVVDGLDDLAAVIRAERHTADGTVIPLG